MQQLKDISMYAMCRRTGEHETFSHPVLKFKYKLCPVCEAGLKRVLAQETILRNGSRD